MCSTDVLQLYCDPLLSCPVYVGEALHLAKDYQQVTKREFPHTAVAQHIAKKQMSSSTNVSSKERIRTIKAAK